MNTKQPNDQVATNENGEDIMINVYTIITSPNSEPHIVKISQEEIERTLKIAMMIVELDNPSFTEEDFEKMHEVLNISDVVYKFFMEKIEQVRGMVDYELKNKKGYLGNNSYSLASILCVLDRAQEVISRVQKAQQAQ